MAYKIYLCGGMTGLPYEEQKGWRDSVKCELNQYARADTICFFDPTEYDTSDYLKGDDAEELSMKFDVRNLVESDLIICNISSNPLSVGTNIELGIAHNLRIPVILYNPYKVQAHPWQQAVADFQTEDLETLIEMIREYYLPR